MNFLPLHPKDPSCANPGKRELKGSFVGKLDASSMHVIVPCSYQSVRLHQVAYGIRLGEHNDYICSACFGKKKNAGNGKRGERQTKVNLTELEKDDPVRLWKERTFGDRDLRLSPEEAIYLLSELHVLTVEGHDVEDLWKRYVTRFEAIYLLSELHVLTVEGHDVEDLWKQYVSRFGRGFVKRCALYRHLRRIGWVPKPGLSLGCDYVIYRCGPDYYHSSAGLKIVDGGQVFSNDEFQALVRSLSNMKKAVVFVIATVPDDIDSPSCLDNVTLSIASPCRILGVTDDGQCQIPRR
uniref:tRNA-intron lyase n=1 Tax=Steinernema glaseri TaxID=37863 RepID=A0A1I7Z784_9BILA